MMNEAVLVGPRRSQFQSREQIFFFFFYKGEK